MSEFDARLSSALHGLRPAARDPAFRLAVLERRATRQLQAKVMWLICAGLAVTGLLFVGLTGAQRHVWASEAAIQYILVSGSLAMALWSLLRIRRPI